MNLIQLKAQTMAMLGLEEEDGEDYEPLLTRALNEGYDRLLEGLTGAHLGQGEEEPLRNGRDEPSLPEWVQPGLCLWACWVICRSGSVVHQKKGTAFRADFQELLRRIYGLPPEERKPRRVTLPQAGQRGKRPFSPFWRKWE